LAQTKKEKEQKEQEIKKNLSQDTILANKIEIKRLENELEKAVTRYDQVMSKNKGTRKTIDVMRKEVNTAKSVIENL
jgi:lysylphosphatidylglycerol synthetase-like protein (DUF2156 family)